MRFSGESILSPTPPVSVDSELGMRIVTILERENSSESLQHESIAIQSIRV